MRNIESKIKETFLDLIQETSIEKIDVKKLCSILNITRQTFYYHYTSIYDVIYAIYLDSNIEIEASSEPLKIIIPLINYIYDQEYFNKEVAKSNASDALKEFIFSYFSSSILYYLDNKKISETTKRSIARFLANGLSSEVILFLNDNELSNKKNKLVDNLYRFFSKEVIEGLINSFNKH